jgi:hypothetical protein
LPAEQQQTPKICLKGKTLKKESSAFQADFKVVFFRRSLTCGYENLALRAKADNK